MPTALVHLVSGLPSNASREVSGSLDAVDSLLLATLTLVMEMKLIVGRVVGDKLGWGVGCFVGMGVGCFDGEDDGSSVGSLEGGMVGDADGSRVVGLFVGGLVGKEVSTF